MLSRAVSRLRSRCDDDGLFALHPDEVDLNQIPAEETELLLNFELSGQEKILRSFQKLVVDQRLQARAKLLQTGLAMDGYLVAVAHMRNPLRDVDSGDKRNHHYRNKREGVSPNQCEALWSRRPCVPARELGPRNPA